MTDSLRDKLQRGRPVKLTAEESGELMEALRDAMATTLDVPSSEVGDEALIFDDLGLDSIDVFDVLDQLAERYEVAVALEEMPEALLRGAGDGAPVTFRAFAEGLLRYFREAPQPRQDD